MTDREMIEARCKQEGITIKEWRATEDGDSAVLGRYVVSTPDYEDEGFYEGDPGTLSACVVGAEKYGNQCVSFSFTPDAWDAEDGVGNEVPDLHALEPADA